MTNTKWFNNPKTLEELKKAVQKTCDGSSSRLRWINRRNARD